MVEELKDYPVKSKMLGQIADRVARSSGVW